MQLWVLPRGKIFLLHSLVSMVRVSLWTPGILWRPAAFQCLGLLLLFLGLSFGVFLFLGLSSGLLPFVGLSPGLFQFLGLSPGLFLFRGLNSLCMKILNCPSPVWTFSQIPVKNFSVFLCRGRVVLWTHAPARHCRRLHLKTPVTRLQRNYTHHLRPLSHLELLIYILSHEQHKVDQYAKKDLH
ncbi:hypothetical protein ISCGN_010981 [Ixodes scapularis]